MNLRPLAAVAIALSCAFATPSTAGGTVSLDGVRRTHAVVRGQVSEPAFVASERLVDPLEPTLKECGTSSCDLTFINVSLPKGSTAGRFRATVTMPRALNGYAALYNREGERVGKAHILEPGDSFWNGTQGVYPNWQVTISVSRMVAGSYTLVVFDRGGVGDFTADLDFRAYPPDRQPPPRKGKG